MLAFFGSEGLYCYDHAGELLWKHDFGKLDAGAPRDTGPPGLDVRDYDDYQWGFASSPLVIDDLVIVAVPGQLVAYDLATGDPRWIGPAGGAGYSSPHLLTIDGVAQILLMSGAGATSVAPADGTLLW